jgi:hypothetical protein
MINDARAPGVDFNKQNRKTLDYIHNDKDPEQAKAWASTAIHSGPDFLKSRMIDKEALSKKVEKA